MTGGDPVTGTTTLVWHVGEFGRCRWGLLGWLGRAWEHAWLPCSIVSFGQGAVNRAPQTGPGEIDYRLARQSVISEFRKGRLAQHEVCDAHPELRRAARECSEPTRQLCPICEDADLVHVTYVFGPRLPAHGRCITSRRELRGFAQRQGEFAAYVIEVCPDCSWNHLARSFVLPSARLA
jgi:hypothetical protein